MTWQFSTAIIDQSLAPFIRAAEGKDDYLLFLFLKEIKNSKKFGKRNTRGQHLMLELKIRKSRNNLRKRLATVFEFYDVESRKCDHSLLLINPRKL
jgi:hypothetical protein